MTTETPVEVPAVGAENPTTSTAAVTEAPVEKTFTQAELNDILEKRLAREERKRIKVEQEAETLRAQVKPPEVTDAAPKRDDFDDYEAYVRATAVYDAKQEVKKVIAEERTKQEQAKVKQSQDEVLGKHFERVDKAKVKYSDFEDVAFNPRLTVTDHMHDAIIELDDGADILYWLGQNPAEAQRIASLRPNAQAVEIGRLSIKTQAKPNVSNAPEPIDTGKPRASVGPQGYPDDPDEYRKMRLAEMAKGR